MVATNFPCGVCSKTVANNNNALCCDGCDKWVHTKFNFLDNMTYKKLQKGNSPWFCLNCIKDQLPFQSQISINQNSHFVTLDKHSTLKDLLENLEFKEECPISKCYTSSEFNHLSQDNLNIFIHLNISSLSYYIDELNLLLSEMEHRPKIIAISESRIRKNKEPLSIIDIPGYDYEFTATEGEKGGTFIYISKDLTYKNRSDLNISWVKQLKSTFIEAVNENRKNTIVGCIYKHPNMPITEFISDFLEPLLTKISFEKKRSHTPRGL